MGFSGRIEDFPVVDIMQYIHASKRTGTLSFRKGENWGKLFFQEGQIVRAARPGMTNLGNVLCGLGEITREELKAAVDHQRSSPSPRPLGMILEKMGVIDHESLKEAVIRQIQEVIYELITWEEGNFSFDLEAQDAPDDIAVAPEALISFEEVNTQKLLLEAVRMFDEVRRYGKSRRNFGGIHRKEAREKPEARSEIPTDDPRRSLILLSRLLSEGRQNGQAKSLSVNFLKLLSAYLQRAILFLARPGELLGIGAFGETQDFRHLNTEVKNLRLAYEPESLPGRMISERTCYQGKPVFESWLRSLYQRIGAPARSEVTLLPLAGVKRIIGLVYGDNGKSALPLTPLEPLEIAAGLAGLIFENNFLRKNMEKNKH